MVDRKIEIRKATWEKLNVIAEIEGLPVQEIANDFLEEELEGEYPFYKEQLDQESGNNGSDSDSNGDISDEEEDV